VIKGGVELQIFGYVVAKFEFWQLEYFLFSGEGFLA
jgi:hypothetical protein